MSDKFNYYMKWPCAFFLASFFLMITSAHATKKDAHLFPAGLVYGSPEQILTVGQTMVPMKPGSTGGAVRSYSVLPTLKTLPAGLSLNTSTGVITGTPTAISPKTTYTIFGSNRSGTTTTGLTLTVQAAEASPAGLNYACSVCDLVVGHAINPSVPNSSGGQITQYTVSPALPAGLKLDPVTGIVSGTPTTKTSDVTYTITGSNNVGKATAGLTLAIKAALQPPALLSYGDSDFEVEAGKPVVLPAPQSQNGEITHYSATDLPDGLTINAATGQITGTPSAEIKSKKITITGSNAVGSTKTALTLSAQMLANPPRNLRYTINNAFNFSINLPIPTLNPSSDGGKIASYSVVPALPAGLSFNTASGKITGTPTVVAPMAAYVITASNSAGEKKQETQTTLKLGVQTLQPGFIYNDGFYFDGALFWSKPAAVKLTHPQAVIYCANLNPLNGVAWKLPSENALTNFWSRDIKLGKANGRNWVFGPTWLTITTTGFIGLPIGSFDLSYTSTSNRISIFAPLPETDELLVTCVNTN